MGRTIPGSVNGCEEPYQVLEKNSNNRPRFWEKIAITVPGYGKR
jgi:hypothetical protein